MTFCPRPTDNTVSINAPWVTDMWVNGQLITGTTTSEFQFTPHPDMPIAKENAMNISIRTVQVIDGWVGQVLHRDQIIWQSAPRRSKDKAEAKAVKHRDGVIAELFA